ncbi:flagellar hook-associated protein FlgK [Pseudorhodobacter sp. MZDSW-24AT]|uniref:flagellar hook-associated protein FlgK n=1 Tax=Pseudorhodobacter sp. MZDSW-24AT TaxID=2052957 RepID=UPI000C1F6297|nr:flagellar hook-associated protein FlgK [Pseudorhodobacter sp. MZDSW-24AT]PJF09816.1 flagellar hook-associated protein FlgK [Pseudorhodobacter sp. MZDSW-24AT]
MSISGALSSAFSGLTATSRLAEATAANVSNALTEGFARREVQLASRSLGKTGVGVAITGVTRQVDALLLQDLRLASSHQGGRALFSEALTRVETALGTADQSGSLAARIARLESTVIEAAARPEAEARLTAVLEAARSLTEGLAQISTVIATERQTADRQIAAEVKRLNDSLAGVAELNQRIRAFAAAGRDTTALLDQRQTLVDVIAQAVPVREISRGNDQIALYTSAGTLLLDGEPAQFGFTATGMITPDMTLAAGSLSGLSVNGQPLRTAPSGGRLGEGRLAALFALRDETAPEAQANLDALARDLMERVSAPAVDPTRAPGAPGLFTDAGAAFDPLTEPGLAGRLALNAAADPDQGGALWRLRDGLGATTPGPAGFAGRLTALAEALAAPRAQASGTLSPGLRSLSALAAEIGSAQSAARLGAEAETAFAAARSDTLRSAFLQGGVDTDQEMQNLLLIEQAYAANAKVFKTADDMIQTLLGI